MSFKELQARWWVAETMPHLAAQDLFYRMLVGYRRRFGSTDPFLGSCPCHGVARVMQTGKA